MTLLKTESHIGGNRKPQTFRDCGVCGERFGPLPNLKRKFCSKECGYKGRKTGGKKGKKYPHLQRARVANCEICNKEFRAVKDFRDRKQKYCSRKCYEIYWKTEVRPRMKDNPGVVGKSNYAWKGDRAGYHAMHKWITRQKGRPNKCEHCGTESAKKYEWANIDHKYRRNVKDYMRLCTKCHRKYDYENN